jgi:DNA-binding CsgD family transcriptional regulator
MREGRIHKRITEARIAEIYRLSDDPRLLDLAGLNKREFEIAELMADGFSLHAIEQHLKIAGGAVLQYKRRVLMKLGVRTQEEVAATWNELKAEALSAKPQ